ncbi:elongator complex protein 3 [Candidatus Electrothrix sp.]|uniref:elongator complex protein 3 n=1 Tax=Candidatus Electrothrix sp. TaxID=2170559 RepID=UPI004055B53B
MNPILNSLAEMGSLLVIPIFIPHEGCPHCCVFCNQRRISGVTEKQVSGADVQDTVQTWLERKGPKKRKVQVAFYGGSFTGLPQTRQQELLGAVAPFLEQGRVHSLRLSTRPDYIDQQRVALLRQYQVSTVELGVQSMNDQVLDLARRGHTAADVERAIPLLRQASMEIGVQLLLGLPADTRTSLRRTVERVIVLQPDFVRIYPLLVVRNSELADQYSRGEYTPLSLDKAVVLAAWMKARFDRAGIRVVRMGLQAGPELESSLLAGPWHPAFGELVASRLMLRKTRHLLAQAPSEGLIQVCINQRDQSVFRGMKSANVKRLQELGLWQRIQLSTESGLERGTVSLFSLT